MEKFLYIALFSPLVASLVSGLFAFFKPAKFIGYFNSTLIFVSMLCSFYLFSYIYENDVSLQIFLFDWINIGNLNLGFSFSLDHISIIMLLVVTFVSTMVHFYSIWYMEDDIGFNRFFSFLSLFVFSMLVLILADNFAVLFIGWEGVGLCSYLLIGFYYKKQKAGKASNEAFIVNRVGDMGLMIAMFVIYWNIGSLDFDIVFKTISSLEESTIFLIGTLLFIGAMGKSAQFPLHTWLANAMEGPTPVSALIHAATMVTAGVYLVIRCNEIYIQVPFLGELIAYLGAFVAIFAASMALVNNDLKRIIAYSTLSQLGYMFAAAGVGAYNIALFHLFTHAFFKSALFLGAANVMHGTHGNLDIRKMGDLYPKMKVTAFIMIISSLALSGIFPFAGFFSKDKILESVYSQNYLILYVTLLITACLTAFYSFRLVMKVFFVKSNVDNSSVHDAKTLAIFSIIPLVILSIIAGFLEKSFEEFTTKLLPTFTMNLSYETLWILILLASFVSIFGILFAIFKYKKYTNENKKIGFLQKILLKEYYIPKLYKELLVKPYYRFSKFINIYIETKLIDNTIDKIALCAYTLGAKFRPIQSGNLSTSLRLMVLGLFIALLFIIVLLVY
ncbi:NADH-quinone oxidoreductase subunit L [Arcobacter vandammei]|uniref:NADH-quinone oxidoreductase subunit L n=1 Tax=Arcobacter vandammei TaxID=2782243 RepID=UPI0018DF76DF|nr:NADH-quinone oxidoreductase subunit L [Arcobacter vandammei]